MGFLQSSQASPASQGRGGTGAGISLLSAQHPFLLLLVWSPSCLSLQVQNWEGVRIRNLSSKVPVRIHETCLYLTTLPPSEFEKRSNYKVPAPTRRLASSGFLSPSSTTPAPSPAHVRDTLLALTAIAGGAGGSWPVWCLQNSLALVTSKKFGE